MVEITSDGTRLLTEPLTGAPDFSRRSSPGALLGVQRGSSARTASARVLAGPIYYHPLGSDHDGGGAFGLQARADVSTPPWMHTAVVGSLRHSVLPSYRGGSIGITSFGVGLRIQ